MKIKDLFKELLAICILTPILYNFCSASSVWKYFTAWASFDYNLWATVVNQNPESISFLLSWYSANSNININCSFDWSINCVNDFDWEWACWNFILSFRSINNNFIDDHFFSFSDVNNWNIYNNNIRFSSSSSDIISVSVSPWFEFQDEWDLAWTLYCVFTSTYIYSSLSVWGWSSSSSSSLSVYRNDNSLYSTYTWIDSIKIIWDNWIVVSENWTWLTITPNYPKLVFASWSTLNWTLTTISSYNSNTFWYTDYIVVLTWWWYSVWSPFINRIAVNKTCPTCPSQYTSLECQSEYSLIPISSVDSNYCENNNLCSSSWWGECESWTWDSNWSALYINDIQHLWKPIISIDIPEEIDRDYLSTDSQFNVDIIGYNVDYEKINTLVDLQSYKPSSDDFTKLISDNLPLILKYLVIVLFLFFVYKGIKKPFSSKKF